MPLTPCADCGREISTQAVACPGCGRPQATEQAAPLREWTVRRTITMFAVVVGVGGFVGITAVQQMGASRAPTQSSAASGSVSTTTAATALVPAQHRDGSIQPASTDVPAGFATLVANVGIGKALYLKSGLEYIGEIADVTDAHRFDDGTTRQAILVKFANGGMGWVPRDTAERIYVTSIGER